MSDDSPQEARADGHPGPSRPDHPADVEQPQSRKLEIATTVLLTIAAVATAWATYQAARWHDRQSLTQSKSLAARIESTRAANVANLDANIDLSVFTQWYTANSRGEAKLADYYRRLFRGEFRPAFDAWLKENAGHAKNAAVAPFTLPQYQLGEAAKAHRLLSASARYSRAVADDSQTADTYLLATVLFAIALFFAGLSTRALGPQRVRLLIVGYTIFVAVVIWIGTLPVVF